MKLNLSTLIQCRFKIKNIFQALFMIIFLLGIHLNTHAQTKRKIPRSRKTKELKRPKRKNNRSSFSEAVVGGSNSNTRKQLPNTGDGKTFKERIQSSKSRNFKPKYDVVPLGKRSYPNHGSYSASKFRLFTRKQKRKLYKEKSQRMQRKVMTLGRPTSSRVIATNQIRRGMLHRSRGVRIPSSKQKKNHYKKTSAYNLKHSGIPLKQWKKTNKIRAANRYASQVKRPRVRVFSKTQKKRYYSKITRSNAKSIPNLRAVNLTARRNNLRKLDRKRANMIGSVGVLNHKSKINHYRKISSQTANFCSSYTLASDARRNSIRKMNEWSANYTGNVKTLTARQKEKMYRQFSKKYLLSKGNMKFNWLGYYWKRLIGKPDAVRTSIKSVKPKRDKKEYQIWNH